MDALKRFVLRAWARGTHVVEHEAGLLLVLYLLNFAPIAWLNIHMYKGDQLGVLAADAIFLLGGVLLADNPFTTTSKSAAPQSLYGQTLPCLTHPSCSKILVRPS